MPGFDLDLFVIGAGSGGVRAARIAAGYGAKVMTAEEYRVGGTCVIRGCVPKKLLAYASRFADDFEDAAGYGWTLPAKPTFSWQKLIGAKDKEIGRLSAIYRTNLGKAGVEIVGILQTQELRQRLTQDGADVVASTPQEFAAYLALETKKWAQVIKQAGIRAD